MVLGPGLDDPAAEEVRGDPEPEDEQRTREARKEAGHDRKHIPHDRLEATCDDGLIDGNRRRSAWSEHRMELIDEIFGSGRLWAIADTRDGRTELVEDWQGRVRNIRRDLRAGTLPPPRSTAMPVVSPSIPRIPVIQPRPFVLNPLVTIVDPSPSSSLGVMPYPLARERARRRVDIASQVRWSTSPLVISPLSAWKASTAARVKPPKVPSLLPTG